MSSDAAIFDRVTIEDWVALPEADGVRYELDAGHLYLMTGGTLAHALVAGAVANAVASAARHDGCRTYQSDARLVVGERGFFPDVMVVCEPMDSPDYETAPRLLVEVLSPSTQRVDRSLKAEVYRTITSLRTYLIVSADHHAVELHRRRVESTFDVARFGPGDHFELDCPNVTIAVDDLYLDLTR